MAINENKNLRLADLEALLFYYGEPIQFKKIASILGLKEEEVEELINAFSLKLEEDKERGLRLLVGDGRAQLITRVDSASIVQKIAKDDLNEELTPAALETLAIVSYLGPIGRAQIDYIRGVNSTFILRSLILRGLIEKREGRNKGVFYEYAVSFDFLKHVGMEKTEQLPDYLKFRGILEKMRLNEEKIEANK